MDNEAQLIQRAVQGDADSFGKLVERYHHDILRIVSFATADVSSTDDLVQETFLRAFRHIAKYDPQLPIRNWLITIALNVCRTHHRQRIFTLPWLDRMDGVDSTFESRATQRVVLHEVLKVMSRLKQIDREILTLHYINELSIAECAELLGIPVGTAKSR